MTNCKVVMDSETFEAEDFVAILSDDKGRAQMLYNTDALTLGMAMKMVARAFVTEMNNLSEEDRNAITEILGGGFVAEENTNE